MAFRSRRSRSYKTYRPHALHPAAIVAICLVGAVLLTVTVGLILGKLVDDETYRKLTEGETEPPTPTVQAPAWVPAVNAYPYALGADISDIVAMPAASVALNTPTGELCYTSPISSQLDLVQNAELSLQTALPDLMAIVPYVSGVFYPQAWNETDGDLEYLRTAKEAVLLREFFRFGGKEIVLCGLPITPEALDKTCNYLATVKQAVGSSPIGVCIPYDIATDRENWELLAALESACDFLLLDLRDRPLADDVDDAGFSPSAWELVTNADYFLSTYSARLLLSKSQPTLLATLEIKIYPNFQVTE